MRQVGSNPHPRPAPRALSEREQLILRSVVESFIETADPVGSRLLSKQYVTGLSAATIRNTMSDLEEWGFLGHPYTSAGRIPTDLGYRTYVDGLMEVVTLSANEKLILREELAASGGDTSQLLRETTRLLGRLSKLLSVALTPRLSRGILERIEAVPLASNRIMFVLSVQGGLVKTIVLEVETELKRAELDRVVTLLNERLSGLRLDEIRRTFNQRLHDLQSNDPTGVVKLVMGKAEALFSELPEEKRVQVAGATQLMTQPEFREPEQMQRLVGLLENEEVVVQLLESQPNLQQGPIRITIGREHQDTTIGQYSLVTANYKVGDSIGSISLIGPTRMNYARAIALIEYVSKLLSQS